MAVAALNPETLSLLLQAASATDKTDVTAVEAATSRILASRALVKELSLFREAMTLVAGEVAGTGATVGPENSAAQNRLSLQTKDWSQIAAADRGIFRMLSLEVAEMFQRYFEQGGVPVLSKGVRIQFPGPAEEEVFFHTPMPVTISRIYGETDTGTVDLKIKWRPEGSILSGGTEIESTALVATSSGAEQTSGFEDDTIPAGSALAIVTSATSGSPLDLMAFVEFKME